MKLRKLLTLVSTLGLCLVTNFTFSLAHAETGFGDDYKDDHEPTKIECGNDDVFDD